jgi:uncharacterized membrane protein YkoI
MKKSAASLLCALLLAATSPAWADVGRDEAAAVAQRQTGGRVLAVERVEAGGHAMWRVKVVTPSGDIRVILVDVATGRPM